MWLKRNRKWYGIDFLLIVILPLVLFFGGAYVINKFFPVKEFTLRTEHQVQIVEKYPEEYMQDNHLIMLTNQSTPVKNQEFRVYNNVVLPAITEKYRVKEHTVNKKEVWSDNQTYPNDTVFIYRINIGGESDLSIYVRVNQFDTPTEIYVAKW